MKQADRATRREINCARSQDGQDDGTRDDAEKDEHKEEEEEEDTEEEESERSIIVRLWSGESTREEHDSFFSLEL